VRYSLTRLRRVTVKWPVEPSLRTSPPRRSIRRRCLAHGPQPARNSHGLPFPTAHEASKVHFAAGFACPLRSALRVWLPSRRFAPSDALPALFRAGGAPGIRPSELSPPERYPGYYAPGSTHVPFLPSFLPPLAQRAGPTGRGFWASALSRVPWRRSAGLARRALGAPLGFASSRYSSEGLARDFAQAPLSRFRRGHKARAAAPQSFDQPSPGLDQRGKPRLGRDDPRKVFAPAQSRHSGRPHPRAYGFASGRAEHCCPTITIFAGENALPELPRLPEVPSFCVARHFSRQHGSLESRQKPLSFTARG
jgi:hypothetical protein